MFDFVRLYWLDWFENRTHSKMGVRFCSIAEPNRTVGVRLGSIGFLFGFVRLHRSGISKNYLQIGHFDKTVYIATTVL